MSYQPAVFPDIEVVLVGYFRTLPLPSGTLVGISVPVDYDGSQSVVRVNRIGGPTNWPIADLPSVEISCWGPDRATAAGLRDIIRLNMTWMVLATADLSEFGARISNPIERIGPQWLDEEGYVPAGRYFFEVSLGLRNA